ncbi:MAG: nucleotide exchange factor GrpE [Pseudomonadota bacterium]
MQQDKAETPKPAEETAAEAKPEQTPPGQEPTGVDGNEPTEAAAGEAEAPLTEEAAEQAADPQAERIAALEVEVEALKAEAATQRDHALRAMAEAENTRRRAEREKSDALKYAAIPLLRDLVKVADNIGRAMEAAGDGEGETGPGKALREGVALTEKELLSAFTKHGVVKIDPKGEPLNPDQHEAMFEIPDEAAEPGTVLQVLEPGWQLHGRLIRAARVGVAKKP